MTGVREDPERERPRTKRNPGFRMPQERHRRRTIGTEKRPDEAVHSRVEGDDHVAPATWDDVTHYSIRMIAEVAEGQPCSPNVLAA